MSKSKNGQKIKRQHLGISMPVEMLAKLDRIAKSQDRSKGAVIRRLIEAMEEPEAQQQQATGT